MRMWGVVCSFFVVHLLWAASPNSNNATGTTLRITSAEVHLALSAIDNRTRTNATLTPGDIVIMCDGISIDSVPQLGSYHHAPLSLLVLTDVSESMEPGLALDRAATQQLEAEASAPLDQLSLLDFGFQLEQKTTRAPNLTSLYDSLLAAIAAVPHNSIGRRTILVLTDGDDNYSYHSLPDVIAAAQKNDVAIYAITAHPGRKQSYRPDVLQKLCDETGGEYFAVTNAAAMAAAVNQVTRDLRDGYELVFKPDTAQAGIHHVAVRSLKAGIRFMYRTAYYQTENSSTTASQGQ